MRCDHRNVCSRQAWLAGVSISAMVLASGLPLAAHAQGAPSIESPAQPRAAVGTVGVSSSGKLEEVVVTAQRRRQNVQKAPVAIAVIGAAAITNAGVTTAQDLTKLNVSAQFASSAGPFPVLYIRGVGANTGSSFIDSAVTLSYDGVPVARSYAGVGQYFDLDRVEVLIGPQGTLYGRNATGGVVNIIPTQPKLGVQSYDFGLDYGNYNTLLTSGAINEPLADNAAVRLAFRTNRNDAYYTQNDGARDDAAARVQLRYDPTTDVSTVTDFDYYHRGGSASNGVSTVGGTISNILVAPGTVLRIPGTSVGYPAQDGYAATDPHLVPIYASQGLTAPTPGSDNANDAIYGLQSQINWTTPLGTLTVVPSFRHTTLDYLSYGAGFGILSNERDSQETVEARFTSRENSDLRFIAGFFFLHDFVNSRMGIDAFEPSFLGVSLNEVFTVGTTSYAPFADATYNITPTLRLIGGIRYTIDQKSATGTLTFGSGGSFSFDPPPSQTFERVTYRGGVQWDVAPQSLLYATYATGWHSGGFFLTPDNPVYQPENLSAITLGSKNRFLNGALQANFEAYYWKYTNQQVSFVTLDSQNSVIFATKNVGSSTREGVDADFRYRIAENTTLGLQGEYLDAEFQKYTYFVPAMFGPSTGCAVSDAGNGQLAVDCAHTRVPFAPHWTGNVSLDQQFPLANGGGILALVNAHAQSAVDTGAQDLAVELQKAYLTLDASLGYSAPAGRWSITLFGDNITNQTIKSQTNQSPASGILGTHQGIYFSTLLPPAEYGVRLRVSF